MLSAVENPKAPLKKRSGLFGVSKEVIATNLKSNKFKPYKPEFTHILKVGDFIRRFEFCAWFQWELGDNNLMAQYIIFFDEATFTFNGIVNIIVGGTTLIIILLSKLVTNIGLKQTHGMELVYI